MASLKGAFSDFVDGQGFVVLDGGLATELEARGARLDHPLWSAKILVEAPEEIAHVHHAYFCAGADVAITASYQATLPGLRTAGLSDQQAEEALRRSVSIAEQARERFWNDPENRLNRLRPLIAASIGPYGAFLHDGSEYRGDYGVSREALSEFHAARLKILTACQPDVLACESIPSLPEAEALASLLEVPAWVSFTCKDGTHISDGTRFADAVAAVCESPHVIAVGVNCTPPAFVNSLLEQARQVTDKPLVAYPNSGESYDGRWHSASEVCSIERLAPGWRERGALLIGGCCRTTPETIRGIRRALAGGEST